MKAMNLMKNKFFQKKKGTVYSEYKNTPILGAKKLITTCKKYFIGFKFLHWDSNYFDSLDRMHCSNIFGTINIPATVYSL